jgi:vesicular inhibitory amino acid transporter
LLGLPYAFAKAGMVGGMFAILSFSFITWKTSVMIGRELNGDPRPAAYFDDSPWKSPLQPGSVPEARMRKPISSFPDIAREAFGEVGCLLLSLVLYFELFSCICIFIVTIGDHMHTLFPSIPTTTHMIAVGVASTIPIILLRTARLLSYLSMIGTFATISVVAAVVMACAFEGDMTERAAAKMADPPSAPYHGLWHTEGVPLAFGLVAYCFSGHAIIPSIYSSMQRPQDFERVVDITYVAVLACCLAVGLSGYLMFGSLVFDQVTISLEENSSATLAMTILTYLMILTAFSKITLTMFPLALGMEEIVAPYLSSDQAMELVSALIKILLILLALWVAIYIPSFSFLCSMVGMICTMTVSVVFPAAAYLKMFGPKLKFGEKAMYWIFVIVGAVMAVVGTALTL